MLNLFNENIKRNDLLKETKNLNNINAKNITINIHRNHSFEPIKSIIKPFLSFSNINAIFNISQYDDSFSFDNIKNCDLEIIWIDLKYYKNNIYKYLKERLNVLRSITKAPILVIILEDKNITNIEIPINCEIYNIFNLLNNIDKSKIIDEAKLNITGTRLSNVGCIKLAQILGLSIIPSLILPTLKAIILDLDNTLYSGILGEDGINNIVLTNEHIKLQNKILEYKKKGFLLAISSKNNEDDVKELFEIRSDFPIKIDDFDCIKANWDTKIKNIKNIANIFNINPDSMLFIDDNIAEIENVKPLNIKTILATNPKEVLRIIEIFPQMRKNTINKEDSIRSIDIKANKERNELQNLSTQEYFKNLQLKLELNINDKNNINRITELLNKTNQFIASYIRPTIEEVNALINNNNICVISISMSDRLSDSGIIGIIIGEMINNDINIIEIVISCRALGRKLEEIILNLGFNTINDKLNGNKNINIIYKKGERNKPFLNTLASIYNKNLEEIENNNSLQIKAKKIETYGLDILIKDNYANR